MGENWENTRSKKQGSASKWSVDDNRRTGGKKSGEKIWKIKNKENGLISLQYFSYRLLYTFFQFTHTNDLASKPHFHFVLHAFTFPLMIVFASFSVQLHFPFNRQKGNVRFTTRPLHIRKRRPNKRNKRVELHTFRCEQWEEGGRARYQGFTVFFKKRGLCRAMYTTGVTFRYSLIHGVAWRKEEGKPIAANWRDETIRTLGRREKYVLVDILFSSIKIYPR